MNYHVCIYEPCVKNGCKNVFNMFPPSNRCPATPPLPTSYPWIQTDRRLAPLSHTDSSIGRVQKVQGLINTHQLVGEHQHSSNTPNGKEGKIWIYKRGWNHERTVNYQDGSNIVLWPGCGRRIGRCSRLFYSEISPSGDFNAERLEIYNRERKVNLI